MSLFEWWVILVLPTSIGVLIDGFIWRTRHGGKGPGHTRPMAWFVACLLLWVVFFPYYLWVRFGRQLDRPEQRHGGPAGAVLAVLAILAALALLVWGLGGLDRDTTVTGPAAVRTPVDAAPSSNPPREEKQLYKFEGNADQVTRPFTVPDRWEIRWSFSGGRHHSIVTRLADGTYGDLLVNESDRPVQGSAFQPKGGSFYLEISSEDPYVIEVWQLT